MGSAATLAQARAFGVGVVIATQNPMDLDYRALGNAGLWCIGRLQTDADRARVIDGLTTSGDAGDARELGKLVQSLSERWFVVRDVHGDGAPLLVQPRWAMARGSGATSTLVDDARTDDAQRAAAGVRAEG